ncbi:hypothetical protein RND81_09G142700 [Saponaria officinalis]|uniref:Uncharacterized protein n=1 Tax=Saponaria officinalis TaxID=3572 RepID=A0AAW1ILM4_SAPOF
MASSTIYHVRSVSLPTRPHPVAEKLDEQLCRLRSSQAASTASSSSSVSYDLNGLKDLYSSVDELLQLPLHQNAKWVDDVLDGSLRLLDICSASRDALKQSRERLQDVQSALRRRCSGELSVRTEVVEYLNMRRTIKKVLKKCLKSLKPATEQNNKADNAAVNMLEDVQAVTADTFKTLLSYIVCSRKSGWSVVAKMISKIANKETSTTEFDAVDATLNSLICQKKSGISSSQMENLTQQTLKLEAEIQDLDESLECLFRHLVKCRATLLNIISH